MAKKLHKKLSAGRYDLSITAPGYDRYTARFKVSSSGSVSCVSVSAGICSSSKRPSMSASGSNVVAHLKTSGSTATCRTNADCKSGYECFAGACRKISSGGTTLVCTTTANFSYTVNGKRVSFRDTSRTNKKSGTGSCSIRERYWVFNNDDEEFIANPSYTFPSYNRSYPVKLRVKDSSGRSTTVTKTIRTGSSSGGGGGTGGTTTTDWDTETKSLAAGADHTIRVSHGDYDMLTMKIRISSSGAVSCISVDNASNKCDRSTPPGIVVKASTITAWMKKSSTPGGGGGGVCEYITSIGGKNSIEWTRDVLGSYYKFIGLKDTVNYDPSWNDVLTEYYYFIGLDSRAEGLTHCGF